MNKDSPTPPPTPPEHREPSPGSREQDTPSKDIPRETPSAAGQALPLPHERDASSGQIAEQPNPKIAQAKKDLDAGQVDTDMWGTAGLDHARKQELVPNTKPE